MRLTQIGLKLFCFSVFNKDFKMAKDYVVGVVNVMDVTFFGDYKVTKGVPCLPLSINEDGVLVKFWDISDNPFIGKVVLNDCVLFCKEDKIEEIHGSRKNLFESYGFQNLRPVEEISFKGSPNAPDVWRAIDPWSCV